MLNDYKPTQDPNIDTFKVEYLLGGSAVLGILFPYKYEIIEVHEEMNPSIHAYIPIYFPRLKQQTTYQFLGQRHEKIPHLLSQQTKSS